jgi:RimJ/RimL family protein N-acetyltransferase
MNIQGKFVTLRALEEEDIELIRQLTNDPWYESMIVGWAFPRSSFQQKKWFENYNPKDELRLAIETPEDGTVGMTGLIDIDWKNATARAGGMRIFKKDMRSKGVATDAYMALFRYAFEELRLNRIQGSVLSHNKASIRATEKAGFKQEGIMRQAIYKNGKFMDVILLGIIKEDYLRLVSQNNYWNSENK